MTSRRESDFSDDDEVIEIELGVSRRKLMKQLTAVGIAGGMSGLAGCNSLRDTDTGTTESVDTTTQANQEDGSTGGSESEIPYFTRVPLIPPPTRDQLDVASPNDPERNMVFVTHNGTNQFFTPVIAGMNDALNKLGWKGEFTGPTGNNQAKQVEILNTKIDSLQGNHDLLGTTVLNASSYAAPVKKASDKGVTVVQYNTTVEQWDFEFMMNEFERVLPYIGQRQFPAGNAVGVTAYEKAREMLGEDETLTVLPCIAVPGHPALQARTDGFQNSIGAQDNVEMLEELNVSTDVAKATTRINDAYKANSDINVILGSGFWAPAGAAKLVQNEELQGEMVVGGFDLPESTLQGIQNGNITFTVGQDPYSQGFQSVMLGFEYVDRGIPMKDYITGVSIVDESNVEFAVQRSGSWSDLVDWQKENYNV